MSVGNSPAKGSGTSGRNAYFVLSHGNLHDPDYNRNYLTAKPKFTSNVNLSANAPNLAKCVEQAKDPVKPSPVGNKCAAESISSPRTPLSSTTNTTINTKSATSVENSSKVLTGMDRYITITKRKSSPRASMLEPNPKQPKNASTNQNRFAPLANQKTENTVASVKSYKPPPLYLREATSNILVNKLTQLIGKENFYVVSLRKGNIQETKIQIKDEKNYRIVINKFDDEKRKYYTYQLKSAKGLVVVIKGIDSSVPTDDIKEALQSEGYEVKSIHNIFNKDKVPQPLFRVEIAFNTNDIKKKGDSHPIYDLKYLLNRRITVEEPIKPKGPPQCHNCQEYGHTRAFCKLPSVCVRCGDIHKSMECPHSKAATNFRKCSNCGENHTANYRGCSVYLQLKNKSKISEKMPVHAEYNASNFPSLPKSITDQQEIAKNNVQTSRKVSENFSYAHALKEGMQPITNSNPQGSLDTLINTMNNFMTNMQNMLQQLLQNQNMLMQILLNQK